MFTITQLITPQPTAIIRSTIVTALVSLGIPANQWRSGGVASTIITVVATTLSLLSGLLASMIQGFFLPLATGGTLRTLAYYVYGVTAPSATFASGSLTLTNSGGGVYTVAINQLTFLNPTTKQTYTNTASFVLPALSSLTIAIACTVAGSVGNASPGQINTFVTPLTGVTCNNIASVVGIDDIADIALRSLCLASLSANSPYGPRTAYQYAIATAINPVTGNVVNINRSTISAASSTGQVSVSIASPSGAPDPNDVTGVATNIEAIARPDAVAVTVTGATNVAYGNTLTIWCTAPTGTSASQIQTAVASQLTLFFEAYPIGGQLATDDSHSGYQGLFADSIKGAIAIGVASVGGTLISVQGATDITLSSTQVAIDSIVLVVNLILPAVGTVVS